MASMKELVKKIMGYYPLNFMKCKNCIEKNEKPKKTLKKTVKDKKEKKGGI